MNIEKLEAILRDMRTANFSDLSFAQSSIRSWATEIQDAITEHLVGELGALGPTGLELGSSGPGGHGWDDDGIWRDG